ERYRGRTRPVRRRRDAATAASRAARHRRGSALRGRRATGRVSWGLEGYAPEAAGQLGNWLGQRTRVDRLGAEWRYFRPLAVSSRGLGRSPLKAQTRVRIPLPLLAGDEPPSSNG